MLSGILSKQVWPANQRLETLALFAATNTNSRRSCRSIVQQPEFIRLCACLQSLGQGHSRQQRWQQLTPADLNVPSKFGGKLGGDRDADF